MANGRWQVAERPILMSGAMVRAILAGRKTQTRRVVKLHPCVQLEPLFPTVRGSKCEFHDAKIGDPHNRTTPHLIDEARCPYGEPGDRLWVKETFKENDPPSGYIYRASDSDYGCTPKKPWKPSIFMPRNASRITLEIVSVRVERLQAISPEDARAEGCGTEEIPWKAGPELHENPWVATYARLWESINGAGSWDANPWVWVVEFKRVESGVGR